MHPRAPRLDMLRGLRAALIAAISYTLALLVAALLLVALRCLISDYTAFERWAELRWMLGMIAGPIVGGGLVCGCAAWATFAPVGNHRFVPSLAIVSLVSLASWITSTLASDPPLKGVEPSPSISDLAVLLGPPVASAVILGATRAFRSSQPRPPNGGPSVSATRPGPA